MPIYIFQNPSNGEVKEVVQKMNEDHKYSEDGIDWKRIFTVPQANVTVAFEAFSKSSFLEKTKNVKTYGEAWKISQEFSDARAEKTGNGDPIDKKARQNDEFYKKFTKK